MSDAPEDIKAPSSDQIEFLRHLQKMHAELPQSIREKAAQLRNILRHYNPLDVIGNVAFMNIFFNPETYKEPTHEGLQAHVEYVTLLCLQDEYREGETRLIDGPTLEKIETTVRDIFRETLWYYITESADPENPTPRSGVERLRQQTIIEELVVRSPAYFHHLEEMLRDLFSLPTIRAHIRKTLDFDILTALKCVRVMGDLAESRLHARRDAAKTQGKRLRAAACQYRRTHQVDEEFDESVLRQLAALPGTKVKELTRNYSVAWAFTAFGEIHSFSPTELALATCCDEREIQSLLQTFSVAFGAVPADFFMPSPTHPLQLTPVVRHPGGYFCPIPDLFLWAIRPRIEAILKNDAKLWDRYQKARAGFLIDESLRWFKKALPAAETHKSLKYTFAEKTHSTEYELDGLVSFDTVTFLIEGKAGGLTPPSRRGAPLRLQEEMGKLLAEPHRQALRARAFITETAKPTFILSDGTLLEFDKSRFKKFVLVTVTLDSLDPFTTTLHKLRNLGVFPEGDLPWAIYLLNLRIISEMLEFPSQLVHYLGRRLPINEVNKYHAHDELDWFGNYLVEGLFFEGRPELAGVDNVALGSYTTDFDDYYRYEMGRRDTTVAKPRQKMPDIVRQVIAELERNNGYGYLAATTAILDMSGKSWKDFARFVERQRKQAARDGIPHDFTLTFDEGRFGLTFMCARDLTSEELGERLAGFCVLKKYQARANRWVGIGSLVREPGIVHMWVANEANWEHDEELEKLSRQILPKPVT